MKMMHAPRSHIACAAAVLNMDVLLCSEASSRGVFPFCTVACARAQGGEQNRVSDRVTCMMYQRSKSSVGCVQRHGDWTHHAYVHGAWTGGCTRARSTAAKKGGGGLMPFVRACCAGRHIVTRLSSVTTVA
jgi:hypothetical protein